MTFTQAEKDERRAEYRRYLKSRLWKAIRGAAIHRAGGVCEWCKGMDLLQVHHAKYPAVFGAEEPWMLRVLCDPCHAEQHGRPYIIHKLSREKRKARHRRIKTIAREKREGKRKLRAIGTRAKWNREPTTSIKDRF